MTPELHMLFYGDLTVFEERVIFTILQENI